jgi:signal transduction histidine kinase
MLESFELYTEIKRKNSQLKTSVERLKRTEQELRLHKQKLENLVAQRTRDLIKTNEALKLEIEERKKTEQKLLLAQKKAKKANQIKNKFLANLSHELRTPLNAILGMTELALMEKIDSQTKEYLDIAYKAAQGLSTMIDDLLDMSLIEYGQLEIKKEPFDLRKILDSVLDIFLHKAQSKGLLISSHLDPGIPELLIGDFSRLRQVLVNLVGNAIKFTDQGEIRIHVQLLKQIDEHTILLKFAVQDTGCGIPKDKMDLIFERFTQVDGSYTRQHGGTGLGLALCKKIVTLLGGRIWVESMPGKGSTFYFTLPFFLED